MEQDNVVVDTPVVNTPAQPPMPDQNVVVNINAPSNGGQTQPTTAPVDAPIVETTGVDIGMVQPLTPQPMESQPAVAPEPLVGAAFDEIGAIEMLSTFARSAIYNKVSLQKAGLDAGLYSAMAYNESKNRQAAVMEYQGARKLAQIEAEVTGYYIAPEHKDLLVQKKMAEMELQNPNANRTMIQKARDALGFVNAYFKSKGLSEKGVETLAKINVDREYKLAKMENNRAAAAQAIQNKQLIASENIGNIQMIYSMVGEGVTLPEVLLMTEGKVSAEQVTAIYIAATKALVKEGTGLNKLSLQAMSASDVKSKSVKGHKVVTGKGKKKKTTQYYTYQGNVDEPEVYFTRSDDTYTDSITGEEKYQLKFYSATDYAKKDESYHAEMIGQAVSFANKYLTKQSTGSRILYATFWKDKIRDKLKANYPDLSSEDLDKAMKKIF